MSEKRIKRLLKEDMMAAQLLELAASPTQPDSPAPAPVETETDGSASAVDGVCEGQLPQELGGAE